MRWYEDYNIYGLVWPACLMICSRHGPALVVKADGVSTFEPLISWLKPDTVWVCNSLSSFPSLLDHLKSLCDIRFHGGGLL